MEEDKGGDALDTILGVMASLDWITPLAAIIQDALNGPSHTFLIPYSSSPLSGREISWMLSKRGVDSWGMMVVSGTLMVSVREGQARWAQHLLEQAGVPIENPLAGQAHQGQGSQRQGSRRPQEQDSRGFLAKFADWLES